MTFFGAISDPLTNEIFSSLSPMSAVFGWGDDELAFVSTVSQDGLYVHGSDWAVNLATLVFFVVGELTFEKV